jgi:hypothetical protein
MSGDAWAMSNEYTTSSRAHLTAMESGVRPSGSYCKDTDEGRRICGSGAVFKYTQRIRP